MPFNALGFFQRLFTFTTDRDNGTKIRADRMDAEFDNVKAAIDDITGDNYIHRGSIKAAQGLPANLSYTFNNDDDTGFYRPASDAISVQTGGAERARFTDAGLSVGGSRVLTQADEGAGKGLDADTLDGQEGVFYQNATNLNAGLVPTARLSGTYAINISGTAATATKAGDADTVDGLHASAFYRVGHATNITSENGVFFSDSASETDNANYYLRDELGALTGALYWQRSNNSVQIAQYNNGQFGSWLGVGNGTVKFNGQTMWHAGNDGAGSGLDADKLDGLDSGQFLRSDQNDSFTGSLSGGEVAARLIHSNGYMFIEPYNRTTHYDGSRAEIWYRGPTSLITISKRNSDDTRSPIDISLQGNIVYHEGNVGSRFARPAIRRTGEIGVGLPQSNTYTRAGTGRVVTAIRRHGNGDCDAFAHHALQIQRRDGVWVTMTG